MWRGARGIFSSVALGALVWTASAGAPNRDQQSIGFDEGQGPDGRAISVRTVFALASPTTQVVAQNLTGQGHLVSESAGRPVWANGELDGVSGLASQTGLANTADDCVLKHGQLYLIDAVELVMGVVTQTTVSATLRIYSDCNGKPDALVGSFPSTKVVDMGTNPAFPGLTFYRFTFGSLDILQNGGERLWLSPEGPNSGLYFWLTSGSGAIQGVQAQYRSAAYGFPNWTDVDQTGGNFGLCTDFNFRVLGKACCLVHDSSDFSLAGFQSQGFPGGIIFLSRLFDNFQIPPGEIVEVCRLEAWFATNCDPSRVFFEIYDDDCDKPKGPPVTIDRLNPGWRTPERVYDGETPLLVDGLPVYHFVVECPRVELRDGRNYWFSVALHWVGTPHERGIWLFGPEHDCEEDDLAESGGGAEYQVLLTEARFRSDFLGVPFFAPLSVLQNPGAPRDFAFKVHTTLGSGMLIASDPRGMVAASGPIALEGPVPSLPTPAGGASGGR